ncbi:HET domain-containing protein [Fusarium sp. LHS14.1]|nr:HET domain-containing protein [Fusarium sp. LHS14.1]
MRLLHTTNLQLETFIGKKTPGYAILSHTWGDDEVLFQDLESAPVHDWRERRGASKVLGAAAQAASDGYTYIWIDTCCIDKSSSAELSEAINSMYAWYKRSRVCYAYLEDILIPDAKLLGLSRWFTRGWTLQELIAPSEVRFFTSSWEFLGSRDQLAKSISEITRIDRNVLKFGQQTQTPLEAYPIAQRMTWASGRTTTRTEDMAYCLLGLFQVNMPLLYGEGRKAFRRLQEEILRQSTWKDHSILLHRESGHIFASQPSSFDIGYKLHRWTGRTDIGMVQDGVETTLHVQELYSRGEPHGVQELVSLAVLDCRIDEGTGSFARPVIVLALMNGYYRHRASGLMMIRPEAESEVVEMAGTHKPLNFHYERPLSLLGVKVDLAKFERKSITLRHYDLDRYTDSRGRLFQIRLGKIAQPEMGQEYEFGPHRMSPHKEILSIKLSSWATVFVHAAILLNAPQDGDVCSHLLLAGSLSNTKERYGVLWHRIIPTAPILKNKLRGWQGDDIEDLYSEILSADYLEPLLQEFHYDNSGTDLDVKNYFGLKEYSYVTKDGDAIKPHLQFVEFLGDSLYELSVTVKRAEEGEEMPNVGIL